VLAGGLGFDDGGFAEASWGRSVNGLGSRSVSRRENGLRKQPALCFATSTTNATTSLVISASIGWYGRGISFAASIGCFTCGAEITVGIRTFQAGWTTRVGNHLTRPGSGSQPDSCPRLNTPAPALWVILTPGNYRQMMRATKRRAIRRMKIRFPLDTPAWPLSTGFPWRQRAGEGTSVVPELAGRRLTPSA